MLDLFEWDSVKARTNRRKHRVDFADAVPVFFDEQGLSLLDEPDESEERWILVGLDAHGRILAVAYT